jgi:hypothetical protein
MSKLDQIAVRIIKEQELIIGPIAWQEAGKVSGMQVDERAHTLVINAPDEKMVINNLVSQYEHFFGEAAREVCKEAASSLLADLTSEEVPSSLA